jgi:hypothetical protein
MAAEEAAAGTDPPSSMVAEVGTVDSREVAEVAAEEASLDPAVRVAMAERASVD